MYGVKVPICKDDYIWVTEDPRKNNNKMKPLLFNTVEEASEHARIWGVFAVVVEYNTTE